MARFQNILALVTELLENHPHLRDNDRKLVSTIWWIKIGEPVEYMNAEDILRMYADGVLPDADSITRCRRRLQEVRQDLRGEIWNKRHQLEEPVIEELRAIA